MNLLWLKDWSDFKAGQIVWVPTCLAQVYIGAGLVQPADVKPRRPASRTNTDRDGR